MLCAMLSTDPPVAVMTDNEWVSKGVNLMPEARNNAGDQLGMTVRHVYGHASVTDVCSRRIASKDAQMNQRADRLPDRGADLGNSNMEAGTI